MKITKIKPDERICEVYNLHEWIRTKFNGLKYGNIFRLFEPDTRFPVIDEEGNCQFIAQSDVRKVEGIALVDCIPLALIKDKD